jgi:hypothetical protein
MAEKLRQTNLRLAASQLGIKHVKLVDFACPDSITTVLHFPILLTVASR